MIQENWAASTPEAAWPRSTTPSANCWGSSRSGKPPARRSSVTIRFWRSARKPRGTNSHPQKRQPPPASAEGGVRLRKRVRRFERPEYKQPRELHAQSVPFISMDWSSSRWWIGSSMSARLIVMLDQFVSHPQGIHLNAWDIESCAAGLWCAYFSAMSRQATMLPSQGRVTSAVRWRLGCCFRNAIIGWSGVSAWTRSGTSPSWADWLRTN